jgi:hypothetical protein
MFQNAHVTSFLLYPNTKWVSQFFFFLIKKVMSFTLGNALEPGVFLK